MQLKDLPKIEQQAIDLLLQGAKFDVLRRQLNSIIKVDRSESGSGMYVEFEFAENVELLGSKASFDIDGVFATGTNCEEIGFILFVKNGLIDYLEGYVYGEGAYPSYEGCDYVLSHQSVNRF